MFERISAERVANVPKRAWGISPNLGWRNLPFGICWNNFPQFSGIGTGFE
jgi:hypothetical protein